MRRDELIHTIQSSEKVYAEIGDRCARVEPEPDGRYCLKAWWRGIPIQGDTDVSYFTDIEALLQAMQSEVPLTYWIEVD
ncbi:hypothetical protein Rctr85_085 [Virus Rctr85]|nr:hypothetical protein Rctr85_085 [Virus Rctr85]